MALRVGPNRDATKRGKSPRVLDLFSGAGGIAWGFAEAGYQIVGGIDCWEPAIESFEANFGGAVGMLRDLRKSDFSDIQSLVGNKGVDVIVGGPSCQGFSTSGGLSRASGRDERDPRNKLFLNYIDLVDHLRPAWVVFENVPGLLLYNQGRVALEIIRAFREIGYSLVPMILLAADFGVPQLRRRLVFVGNRTGMDIAFPAATHGDFELWKTFSLPFAHLSRIGHGSSEQVLPHVTFSDACSDLPPISEGEEVNGVPYPARAQTDYQRKMRLRSRLVRQHFAAELSSLDRTAAQKLRPGQNWRDLPVSFLPERFKKIRPYDATTLLRRLENDKPTYTITTKFNEATTGAFIHPSQPRTLSLREAARLQSLPDHFVFAGSPAQVRHQIGNAVPPMLAAAIAEAILPSVMKDIGARPGPALRDIISIENKVAEADILQLRAPRKLKGVEEPELEAA